MKLMKKVDARIVKVVDWRKVADICRVATSVVGLFLFLYIWGLVVVDTPQRPLFCVAQRAMHHQGKYDNQILNIHLVLLITSTRKPMIVVMIRMGNWIPYNMQYRIRMIVTDMRR